MILEDENGCLKIITWNIYEEYHALALDTTNLESVLLLTVILLVLPSSDVYGIGTSKNLMLLYMSPYLTRDTLVLVRKPRLPRYKISRNVIQLLWGSLGNG